MSPPLRSAAIFLESNPVVLGFGAVNGLHVEGVAEDEGDAFAGAEVCEPVPGEHALDGHDEVFPRCRISWLSPETVGG